MPGLSFLSKKSWHTSNLNNQEKVWLAEQQKAAEEVKIKELARQIQQEREDDELRRMAGGAGSKKLDRGIDWMYQGGGASNKDEEQLKKEAEEYLLGKEFNPSNLKSGDFVAGQGSSMGVDSIIQRVAEHPTGGAITTTTGNHDETHSAIDKPPHQAPTTTSNTNNNSATFQSSSKPEDWSETFRLSHEDPMFFVHKRLDEKIKNAEMKRRIMERATGGSGIVQTTDSKTIPANTNSHSREVKHRKRDRDSNHTKKHSTHYYSDESGTNSDDDYSDRKRSRKDKMHKSKKKKHKKHHRSHHHHRRRRRSRSRSPSPSDSDRDDYSSDGKRGEYSSSRNYKQEKKRDYNKKSSSYSSDEDNRYERTKYKKSIRSDDKEQQRPSNQKSSSYDNSSHTDTFSKGVNHPEPTASSKSYGLQGVDKTKSKESYTVDSLGPDQRLIEKKRQEKESLRLNNNNNKYGGSHSWNRNHHHHHLTTTANNHSRNKRIMTQEEREAALKEMQEDASSRKQKLDHELNKPNPTIQLHDEEMERRMNSKKSSSSNPSSEPLFLQNVIEKAHGLSSDVSLSSRVASKRHTTQVSSDQSFL